MYKDKYIKQVDLLLQVLPYVAQETCFALKGGTAINLFVRDFPRLSVDIDLTYIPIEERRISLENIESALFRIQERINKFLPHINILPGAKTEGIERKLNLQTKNAQIKIEVNQITRGLLFEPRRLKVVESVQEEYGKYAAIQVVSHAELYGGKICAALDRQHPRDLFDIKLLFENEGFTKELMDGFIFFTLSHYKPIHELLNPVLKDQKEAFDNQFNGMTIIPFTYEDFELIRKRLIREVHQNLTPEMKQLLINFQLCENIGLEYEKYPAIKWKKKNLELLKNSNYQKYAEQLEALKIVLNN